MEVVLKNLPRQLYAADKLAGECDVEILRIPIRHCFLNPIELAQAGLKTYVRNLNVNLNLGDIAQLCNKWLAELQPEQAEKYVSHVKKCEDEFRQVYQLAEELENDLAESDSNGSTVSENNDTETDD